MDSINFYLFWIEAWVWKYFAFQKFITLVNSIRRLCSNLNSLFIVVNNWTVLNILCWEHFRKYPSKPLSVFKTSSAYQLCVFQGVLKMSWSRLEDVLQRHLQDLLEDEKLLCWRHLLKTLWRHAFKTSWRHNGDK